MRVSPIEKEERLAGNKLIAMYTNRALYINHPLMPTKYGMHMETTRDMGIEISDNIAKTFKYHCVWSELIPVCKKVARDLKDTLSYKHEGVRSDIYEKLCEMEIVPLWREVIKAIKLLQTK